MAIGEAVGGEASRRRTVILGEVDLASWREKSRRGEVQGSSPFGVDTLETLGYQLHSPRGARGRLRRKVRDVLEHRCGTKIDVPLSAALEASRADLVLALLEQFAVVPAKARRLGILRASGPALVALTCWLADDLQHADAEQARRLVSRFAPVDLLLVLSRNQVPLLVNAGFAPRQVRAIPFGIEQDFFVPPPVEAGRDIDVLAVGQDRGRDYETLFRAVEGTGIKVDVVCKQENLTGLPVPREVHLHAPIPVTRYRNLLQRAKIVVVPTKELAYPTGQTVALEAMSCGAAVVATGSMPMREYLTDRHDSILVGVGDAEEMARAIVNLLSDEALREDLGQRGRDTVLTKYTASHMWRAADQEIAHLLNDPARACADRRPR